MSAPTNAAPGFVTVPTPPLVAPRISLLTSADIVSDTPRWEGGYGYNPETCDLAHLDTICPTPGAYGLTANDCDPIEINPFYIYAADKSSTFNRKTRDFYGRALRNLTSSESHLLEQELMSNTLGLPNPYILDPLLAKTTVTTAAAPPWEALALIEQAASALSGERILIHVRPHVLVQLAASTIIRREGNVWLTPLDNIVVPGRGYPGTGPAGQAVTASSEWIYATGRVEIRRGAIEFLPEKIEGTEDNPFGIPASAINRSNNDIVVAAQRIVSVAFNPNCGVFAAEVDRTIINL